MEYRISYRQPELLPLGLSLLAVLGLGLALALPSAGAPAGRTLDAYARSEAPELPDTGSAQPITHSVAAQAGTGTLPGTVPVLQAASLLPGDLAAPAEGQGPLEALLTALVRETMAEGTEPDSGPVYEPLAGHKAALYLMVCCVEPTGERILGECFSIPTPEGALRAQSNDQGSACLGPLAPGRYTLESSLGTVVFTLAENGALVCDDPLCRADGEYIALGLPGGD